VCIPAVQVVVSLALTTVPLALLIEMTLLMGALFVYFFGKFQKPETALHFGFKSLIRFRV